MKRLACAAILLLPVGCGGSGLAISGLVNLTIHQPGQPDVMAQLPVEGGDTPIAAPPGTGSGLYGTCQHAGSMWTAEIDVAGNAASPLLGMRLMVAERSATASVAFTLDTGIYQGPCSVATGAGDEGADLPLSGQCTALTSKNDPRTVDADLAITIESCISQ